MAPFAATLRAGLGFWIPATHAGTTLFIGVAPWLKILANQEIRSSQLMLQ
jgi:hypothetical protein